MKSAVSNILVEKYSFDTTQHPPVFCNHVFSAVSDGLEHHVDGALRAQISAPFVVEYLTSANISHVLNNDERITIASEFSTPA